MTTTKFDEIVGNPRIFKIILDEVLHDWPGSYDIMPVENPQDRKIKDYDKFAEFCQKVRGNEEGLQRCMNCDLEYAEKAERSGKPLYYVCHAGLMDMAVPIIVGNKLIATIFCGQHRSEDKTVEKDAIQKTLNTEVELGFKNKELLKLRDKTPVLSYDRIEGVREKLWEVATYVSNLGSSKLEAEKAKRDLAYRLNETEAIQKILFEFSGTLFDVATFWKKLDGALDRICEIIGASFGLFATCEKNVRHEEAKGHIKSTSGVLRKFDNLGYIVCNSSISKAINDTKPIIINVDEELAFSDFLNKIEGTLSSDNQVDKIALIPVRLDPEYLGVMILFISKTKDINKSLELKDELSLLAQAATQIATAYENCVLYERQKDLANMQGEWLENVSHQMLAPINEILGQTENLSRYFRTWQKSNPQRIDNTLINLVELSDWATRLAKNFAWVARKPMQPGDLNMRLEDDVLGKLIGYARNSQGLAKTRGINWVHVVKESVARLNGRIVIDNKLFKQAVTNLLDNAVKYANPKTEVTITAEKSATFGQIYITDFGIPIHSDDIEKIFARYYRTNEAKRKYSVGSGIGLGIAREIIRLHGGDLKVQPSEQSVVGWKTTFVITLPLIKETGND